MVIIGVSVVGTCQYVAVIQGTACWWWWCWSYYVNALFTDYCMIIISVQDQCMITLHYWVITGRVIKDQYLSHRTSPISCRTNILQTAGCAQDCTSSILAPQTSSLKWPVNSCLAESQNVKYLSIPNVWLAEWTLSGYKTSSGFLMTVAKTL